MLLQQTHRPGDGVGMAKMLVLVDRLSAKVGLYRLGCNMENDAAWVAYEGMAKER